MEERLWFPAPGFSIARSARTITGGSLFDEELVLRKSRRLETRVDLLPLKCCSNRIKIM